MTDTSIVLNAHLQAVAGREHELGTHLQALVAPSRTEPGCMAYELHLDPDDPGKFMFYERFASQAALDLHLASPHFKMFQAYLNANANPIAAQTVTTWRSIS
jgi:quinol monooxygenase YgiN